MPVWVCKRCGCIWNEEDPVYCYNCYADTELFAQKCDDGWDLTYEEIMDVCTKFITDYVRENIFKFVEVASPRTGKKVKYPVKRNVVISKEENHVHISFEERPKHSSVSIGIDHRDNEVICCYVALNTGGDPDPHPRYIKSLVELEEALAYALKWLETAP